MQFREKEAKFHARKTVSVIRYLNPIITPTTNLYCTHVFFNISQKGLTRIIKLVTL